MILPIIFIVFVVLALVALWIAKDIEGEAGCVFIGIPLVIAFIGPILVIPSYIEAKSNLRIIDDKITVTEEINKQRVDETFPILEKYPELEKQIISGINPNNFAVLGDVYPNLKSNETYNRQANIVTQNLAKVERLRLEKLESTKVVYESQYWIWFLK